MREHGGGAREDSRLNVISVGSKPFFIILHNSWEDGKDPAVWGPVLEKHEGTGSGLSLLVSRGQNRPGFT